MASMLLQSIVTYIPHLLIALLLLSLGFFASHLNHCSIMPICKARRSLSRL